MKELTGGCLCESIRYRCSAAPLVAGHCFCRDCRRSSGTANCSHLAVPRAALTVSGTPAVFERAADSGNMVTRAFCGRCGSPVFSTNAATPALVFVRASSLDDPEAFVPAMNVYVSRAPSWAHVDSRLPTFPEMPPPDQQPTK